MAHNKIFKNSVVVICIIMVGKVLAFFRDVLITTKFGATISTDIYLFSIGLIYLLTTLSYGLTTAFIPIHTEIIEQNVDSNTKTKFPNNVINISLILTLFIIIVTYSFAPKIIYLFAPGFTHNEEVFTTSVSTIRIMSISLIFICIQSVITGVLQSHKQFYEPSSMAIASTLVTIIYLLVFSKRFGIKGFAIAIIVGFFMQLVVNVPKYRSLGYRYKYQFDFFDSKVRKLYKLMLPVVISTSVVQLNLFVNRIFATTLYEGAVTNLDLSNKLNTIMYEVFAIGISMVIYPILSEHAAKNNDVEYSNSLAKALNSIFIITVPAAVGLFILSYPIVNIIFTRGAFSKESAVLTASALSFYCPAMIAYGIRDVLNKAFYSIGDTKTPMYNSFVGILINILLNYFLIKYMYVSGLALATSLTLLITTVSLSISLRKKLPNISYNKVLTALRRIAIASVAMGSVMFFVYSACKEYFGDQTSGNIASIFASGILGIIVYIFALNCLKVEEYTYFLNLLSGKLAVFKHKGTRK